MGSVRLHRPFAPDAQEFVAQPNTADTFQEFVRFEVTRRHNIGFGDLARMEDDDALRDAARRSGALQDIEALPRNWQTVLGRAWDEAGHDLSGGQWQKLAIARAEMFTIQAGWYA